jgi:putative ABC transport system permease protein
VGHYFTVLLRNLRRERLYAAINIAGLALGLACCLILGLFLRSELTYDQHYPDHQNIYRIENEFVMSGRTQTFSITSAALGPMIAAEYPQHIKAAIRLSDNSNQGGVPLHRIDEPGKIFYWERSFLAEENLFDVFPVKVIAGDPKTALKESNSLAISETVATRHFGDEDPIGKFMASDSGTATRVTLVFADLPANTHLKYDLLWTGDRAAQRLTDNPNARRSQLIGPSTLTYTYLLMEPSFRPTEWTAMSQAFADKYMADILKIIGIEWRSWLQPIRDIHLKSAVGFDRPTGNLAYIYGSAAVALIILAVACINYMNLATARAARRARSVGFRKILGASRRSLALEFLGEALFFALIALVVAATVVALVLEFTPINTLMDGKAAMDLLEDPDLALWLVASAFGVGLLSGLYPAFYLSSWAPVTALTGRQFAGKGNLRMREGLVLLQFTVSITAIAVTLLMMAQLQYVRNQPLGFERADRLMVSLRGAAALDKIPAIRNALLADSRIRGVAVARQTPADGGGTNLTVVQMENNEGAMEGQMVGVLQIGEDYEEVLRLKTLKGQNLGSRLSTGAATDVVVNEALVRMMGWTEPLGKRVWDGRVVGVLQDFNFQSLKFRIEPLLIRRLDSNLRGVVETNRTARQRHLILDITGAEVGGVLRFVEKVVADADPQHPFEYRFLDDALDAQYKTETSLTRLMGIFSGVSILIACMGLLGLTAFTTEQRSREIGTRKVLGATSWQVVALLARGVVVLVLLAAVLASAGAYFAIDEWLAGFAYRAGVNPLIFVLAAMMASVLAFLTVALQAWRTASSNPVDSLRQG